jgi:hypothetical protein
MTTACEFLDACTLMANLRRHVWRVYYETYCHDSHHRCERNRLYLEDKPVPRDLLPYGGRLNKGI